MNLLMSVHILKTDARVDIFLQSDYSSTRSIPLSPLQPHQQETVLREDSVPPSLKRKRAQSPPTPCRTPTGFMDLLTSPAGITAGNFGTAAAASISTSISDQNSVFGDSQHARGEGPDDVPPIAFLREQSRSVSPAPSARKISPHLADAEHLEAPISSADTSVPAPRISVSFANEPVHTATANNAPPGSSTDALERILPTTGVTFPFIFYTAPTPSEPTAAVARTRAETGASASEPAPRYRYTYDSLMRRPAAAGAGDHYRNAFYELGGQSELEAACETTEAPVGGLGGPPVLGLAGVAEMLERLHDQTMGRDVEPQSNSVQPSPNTVPTTAYISLLEEAFGPGSVQRGEGAKPVGLGRRRKAGASSRASPNTGTGRSTSRSSGAPDETEVDMEGSGAGAEGGSRALRWIAEIEVLLKGKRQLVREVRLLPS
ncbi:hypothetical protein B0H17DRAFT_438787 [Mycena rosella]|uniref:Uncharacterized protein n=1 Tax=Mycena rosella TaxID=1033263 RepID=A0AAD7CD97_MYCRO|nr:hypothetical protein B0H17DRAFT_438787 [Mycena rosella]